MERNDIKKANRKAMPGFLLITLVGAIVGGIVGFYSAKYGVERLAGSMKSAGAFFRQICFQLDIGCYSRYHTDGGHTCLSKGKKAAFGMGWRG